jgi:hypothetical protein
MKNNMYIVCWCTLTEDFYEVFIDSTSQENLVNAERRYNEVLKTEQDLYSANLCKVIKSTDY